jgi:hypothetical protein
VLVVAGPVAQDLAVVPVHALALPGPLVATAGSWSQDSGAARFVPAFRPVPGTVHAVVALLKGSEGGWRELARVSVPTVELERSTRVVSIDPGADRVPANLLRISVSFSAPMEEGSAAGHLHLRDDDGTELTDTLLAMPPELWDRPRRRLTVLLEPGRIKRGLQPNTQIGPPLTAGSVVTLVVDAQVRDAKGASLESRAERTYRVEDPIRSRVDPRQWDVLWPDRASEELVVRFGRSLDRALVERCLRVVDADGHVLKGQATLDRDAQLWTFTLGARTFGDLSLHIHPDLEDLAGNSVRGVFDRDLREPEGDSVPESGVVLRRR